MRTSFCPVHSMYSPLYPVGIVGNLYVAWRAAPQQLTSWQVEAIPGTQSLTLYPVEVFQLMCGGRNRGTPGSLGRWAVPYALNTILAVLDLLASNLNQQHWGWGLWPCVESVPHKGTRPQETIMGNRNPECSLEGYLTEHWIQHQIHEQ